MHGYFGTCVSGPKSHLWPGRSSLPQAAGARLLSRLRHPPLRADAPRRRRRRLALGQRAERTVRRIRGHRHRQPPHARPSTCATVPRRTACTPSPSFPRSTASRAPPPAAFRVLFLGRMTAIKGGDVLIRAVADASDAARPAHPADDGRRRAAARRLGAAGDSGWAWTRPSRAGWMTTAGRRSSAARPCWPCPACGRSRSGWWDWRRACSACRPSRFDVGGIATG